MDPDIIITMMMIFMVDLAVSAEALVAEAAALEALAVAAEAAAAAAHPEAFKNVIFKISLVYKNKKTVHNFLR